MHASMTMHCPKCFTSTLLLLTLPVYIIYDWKQPVLCACAPCVHVRLTYGWLACACMRGICCVLHAKHNYSNAADCVAVCTSKVHVNIVFAVALPGAGCMCMHSVGVRAYVHACACSSMYCTPACMLWQYSRSNCWNMLIYVLANGVDMHRGCAREVTKRGKLKTAFPVHYMHAG